MVEIFSEELNEEFLSSLKKELSETFSGCKKIAVKIHFGEPGNEKSLILMPCLVREGKQMSE